MNFISNNIKHLRMLKNLTQEYFANELNISRERIASYEQGRSSPPVETLIALSDYFNLPIDVLIKNDLTSASDTSFITIGNQRILFPIKVNEDNEDMIEVVPTDTSAGYLRGYTDPEYIESLSNLKLPFLPTGKHRAFPIKGDSMLPIKSGSFVIAKYLEDISYLNSGSTYIVLTYNDGLVYKRVYDKIEEHRCLLMVSDNKRYDPYYVPVEEILELWEFTCHINLTEYDESEINTDSVAKMLTDIGVQLESIRKKIS
ncbi:MAG: helix-turn-helix domain-containing protein [Flavobacteriaceae bacterium]|nr:helix-turn-helix domain-containing protein [Flavobacteriaceae bacterium]